MLSCIEFIPLYSEIYKFIEEKADHEAVVRYWEYVSDNYVSDMLETLVKEKGIEGCWDYWSKALNEEAADFTMTYDEEKQELSNEMHLCPSKGLLLSLKHMEPYHDYCGHCAVIYDRILRKYDIHQERDHSQVHLAKCKSRRFVVEKDKKDG